MGEFDFNRLTTIPYDLELRDTIDAALYRLEALERAAEQCRQLDDKLKDERRVDADVLRAKGREQSRIFDELEAFLAAWARVSLILFPVSNTPFAKKRGQVLQAALGIMAASLLANRDLRDSWMHFDERLDRAVQRYGGGVRQLFVRASEVTPERAKHALRLIEIDTLRVHYHDRTGASHSVLLADMKTALLDLEERRKSFRDSLPMPDDPC